MRDLILIGALVTMTFDVAPAQPPPPPPPGTEEPAAEAAEATIRFEPGIIIGSPQGDLADAGGDSVSTSVGIGAVLGYRVAPRISVFAGGRYLRISNDDGDSMSHYDFLAGGRYAFPISPTLRVFAEAHVAYATLSADGDSASGIGFGARVGGIIALRPRLGVGGGLGYSTASVEIDGDSIEDAWLALDGFVHIGF